MSLNLGNEAIEAARELRGHPPWDAIRDAILEASRRAMNTALDMSGATSVPVPGAGDALGYARALRDLWLALEAATTGTSPARLDKPGPLQAKPKQGLNLGV